MPCPPDSVSLIWMKWWTHLSTGWTPLGVNMTIHVIYGNIIHRIVDHLHGNNVALLWLESAFGYLRENKDIWISVTKDVLFWFPKCLNVDTCYMVTIMVTIAWTCKDYRFRSGLVIAFILSQGPTQLYTTYSHVKEHITWSVEVVNVGAVFRCIFCVFLRSSFKSVCEKIWGILSCFVHKRILHHPGYRLFCQTETIRLLAEKSLASNSRFEKSVQ